MEAGDMTSVSCEATFAGKRYLVTVNSSSESLEVEVEEPTSVEFWRGRFAASYLEEITSKTGNFKKFGVFVRMLISALRQESDSVFVDLLTYGDLELLKNQRASSSSASSSQQQQQQQQPGQRPAPPATNKRYLILTYAAEFDRVHYPLPLQPEDSPDPQRLKAIIRKLRAAQASSSGKAGAARRAGSAAPPTAEVRTLRDENAALKAQVRTLEAQVAASSTTLAADVQALAADAQETIADLRAMRKERDGLLLRVQQAEAALEGERNLHRRELRRRAKEAADLEGELGAAKDQIRELRLKCRELVQELDLAQRRAKVAVLSADYSVRPRPVPPPPTRGLAGGSRGATPNASRGASPARPSSYRSRDTSPASVRGRPAPPPLYQQQLRSRSAEVSRPSSRPSSRPASAGRFDPTEYVRQKRERERDAAARLEDLRRQGRLTPSRPGSLLRSRPGSMPNSRDSTPQRSRVPSRDPSADRARLAARDSSAGRQRPQQRAAGSWERGGLASAGTQRLRAAVATTQAGIPSREQRSQSPGRALQEVKARLQSFAAKSSKGRQGGSSALIVPPMQTAATGTGGEAGMSAVQQAGSGDTYADASAEIQDIDARLQSLQNFLKAAKNGQSARSPVAVQ